MLHRALAAAACLLAAVSVSSASKAERLSYELDYSADAGCPDKSELVRQVARRARDAELVETGGQWRFVVRLSRSGAQAEGTVVSRTTEPPRRVSGASCAAVAEAVALIVAVTLDPSLILDLNPPTLPAEPSPPQSTLPPRTAEPAPLASEPPRTSSSVEFALGAGGWIIAGPAPSSLLGVSVFGELASGAVGRPRLRLALSHATTGSIDVGSGAAHFELSSARLEGCPAGFGRGSFELVGCLDLEAGRVAAEGLSRGAVRQTQESSRLWFELGLMGRLAWSPVSPLQIELSSGVGFPFTRRAYIFENPREIVHEPPLIAARVGLGLAARLP
jgi:hypothetical protein